MYLAQMNIAKAKYALDDPKIKEFVDNLETVNATAERSDGFVWRLKDDSGNATSFRVFDDPNILVNMSVWRSIDALKNFMFRTHHKYFLRRKKQWFEALPEDTYVLWWIERDKIPSIEQGVQRLSYLRQWGDSPYAFTFKSNFSSAETVNEV